MRHRVRNKSSSTKDGGYVHNYANICGGSAPAPISEVLDYSVPFTTSSEVMDDELGFQRSQRCSHDIIDIVDGDEEIVKKSSSLAGCSLQTFTQTVKGFSSHLQGLPFPTLDLNLGQGGWSRFDIKDLEGKIRQSVFGKEESFFFLEFATDLGRSWRAARRLDYREVIRNANSILRKFRLSRRSTLGGIRRGLRTTSNGFLAYQFGIKPLIHDIRLTLTAYQRAKRKIAKLRSMSGTWVPFQARQKIVEEFSVNDIPAPSPDGPLAGKLTTQFQVLKVEGELFVEPDQRTVAHQLATEFKLFDSIGLVWELIPYSFVVDWFLRLDDRIERFENRFAPALRMRHVNYLRRREWVADFYDCDTRFYSRQKNDSTYTKAGKVGTVKYRSFRRNTFSLEDGTDPSFKGLSYLQRLIALALIAQKAVR